LGEGASLSMTETNGNKCPFCGGSGKETTLKSPKAYRGAIEIPADCKECRGSGLRKPE
jgi:DnaJ-class molecular chaperone